MAKTIEQLAADVTLAKGCYVSAEQRASFARNEATDALNKLNEAQKALDKAIDELRKSAPRDSDWAKREYKAMGC